MMHKMFFGPALMVVLTGSAASAHDARLHKGKPTVGTVEALSDNGLTLKTARGTTPVTFQDKTKFERGEAQASAQEIQQGDRLTVFGTKLPSGELVAREVLLPATNAKGESHSPSTTHQHSGSHAR
jgi:hypothetical protein